MTSLDSLDPITGNQSIGNNLVTSLKSNSHHAKKHSNSLLSIPIKVSIAVSSRKKFKNCLEKDSNPVMLLDSGKQWQVEKTTLIAHSSTNCMVISGLMVTTQSTKNFLKIAGDIKISASSKVLQSEVENISTCRDRKWKTNAINSYLLDYLDQ